MKILSFLFAVLLFTSCAQNEVKSEDDGFTTDTSQTASVYEPPLPASVLSGPKMSAADETPAEERAKLRAILYTGIDSTYAAISQIEDIKNEINAESGVAFNSAERNVRAKALMKLNMIENILARRVDSALLVNLKIHTGQLSQINDGIAENVSRLKNLSDKLAKASLIMERLTGILTTCISKGLIKPATPPTATAAAVKAGV